MSSQTLITLLLQITAVTVFAAGVRTLGSGGRQFAGCRTGLWLGPGLWMLSVVVGSPLARPVLHYVPGPLIVGVTAGVISFAVVLTLALQLLHLARRHPSPAAPGASTTSGSPRSTRT